MIYRFCYFYVIKENNLRNTFTYQSGQWRDCMGLGLDGGNVFFNCRYCFRLTSTRPVESKDEADSIKPRHAEHNQKIPIFSGIRLLKAVENQLIAWRQSFVWRVVTSRGRSLSLERLYSHQEFTDRWHVSWFKQCQLICLTQLCLT